MLPGINFALNLLSAEPQFHKATKISVEFGAKLQNHGDHGDDGDHGDHGLVESLKCWLFGTPSQ